ncbi:MAG: hypothetical protein HY749_00290 [Gammaproteobacteria bacterium]|nr:hypothetical protein [Gammaproteobacteria bacterium]
MNSRTARRIRIRRRWARAAWSYAYERWEFTALPSGRWFGHCDAWDVCVEAASRKELRSRVTETIARLEGAATISFANTRSMRRLRRHIQ